MQHKQNTGKFIAIITYIKKKNKIPVQQACHKKETKLKASRKKKIIKITAEVNPKGPKTKQNKTKTRINNIRSWLFERINTIDNLLL